MNDSRLWEQASRCYEKVRLVDEMSYSRSWAQGFGRYEQLKVVDYMNDLGSHELKSLDAMNNLGLWMIWMIVGCEPKALIVTNNWRL